MMTKHKPVKPQKKDMKKTTPHLGPDIQSRIGGQLRAMYDDVVKQGVPDRFAELLKQIEASQGKTRD